MVFIPVRILVCWFETLGVSQMKLTVASVHSGQGETETEVDYSGLGRAGLISKGADEACLRWSQD